MGFWSSVSSFCSSVCSFVSSAVSGISDFVFKCGPKILGNIGTVVSVIRAVVQFLEILSPNEKIDELGDKAIQAEEAGIKMDNFERYDDYLNEIRNFKLDPEKSKTIDQNAKELAGVGIATKAIENKLNLPEGMAGLLSIFIATKSDYFSANKINSWIEAGKLQTVIDYFDNKLSPNGDINVENFLIKLGKANTTKSENEIYHEILDARDLLNEKLKRE